MIQASLISWESGTDLVIDAKVDAAVHTVWQLISDPAGSAEWFAPFTRIGDRISFDFLDDTVEADPIDAETLEADIVDCQEDSHVLLAFDGLGRVGISVTEEDSGTRITMTQTFEDAADAADIVAEAGPVWETHLRLLCEALGVESTDIPEHELYTRYEELAERARAEGSA